MLDSMLLMDLSLEKDRDEDLEENTTAIMSTEGIRVKGWRKARDKNGWSARIGSNRMGDAQAARTTV